MEAPLILVVDDTPENLTVLSDLLKGLYRVKVANSGPRALAIASKDPKPDLILLDVMMPEMDGWEVCRRLKQETATAEIPVIFLTAKTALEDEMRGFEVGAVDYITKPINPQVVRARIKAHLAVKQRADLLAHYNSSLAAEVEERTREVRAVQEVTIMAMASLAETRDNETGNHIRRTQHYVRALATQLKPHPRFSAVLTDENIELLFRSAPLHDIGKVGIPDRILLKPGPLDESEFEVMKTHARLGHDAIANAEQMLNTPDSFLRFAREIALSHQEKWDGSGYPERLAGDDIPISARLMAVADVYDALISKRYYKPPMSHAQAVEIMREKRGLHFDPDIVDAFLEIQDVFQDIAARFQDD